MARQKTNVPLAPAEVDEVPVTHGREDMTELRGLLCKCGGCGHTARMSPLDDFYTLGEKPDVYLLCERCICTNSKTDARLVAYGLPLPKPPAAHAVVRGTVRRKPTYH